MRATRGLATAALIVGLTTLIVPSATGVGSWAQAKADAKASVVNHDANLRGDGTLPIKIHCAAAHGRQCKGNLRLVVKVNGTAISNTKRAFVVGGKKTKTFRLQATGNQVELFLQAGTRDASVKVREKKPRSLPVHSAVVSVHVPA
jgi:hypothetical protein